MTEEKPKTQVLEVAAVEETERKRLMHLYVATGLSTILFFASFHALDFGLLAWVALVPWLFYAFREDTRTAVVMSYGTTFLYHLLGLSWIGLVTGPGWVATTFLEGFYSVAVVLAVRRMRRRTGLPVMTFLPWLWVMGEHHRGAHLLFIKFPWLLIGQSQHARTNLIQIADVTSIYGLSFLVVLVNAFIVDVALFVDQKNREKKDLDQADKRALLKLAIFPAAALLLANVYGAIRSSQVAASVIDGPRVLAVQCNVPQELKENLDRDPYLMLAEQNFEETRLKLVGDPDDKLPDAILWSETVWLYPLNTEFPSWTKFDAIWGDRLRPDFFNASRRMDADLFQLPVTYRTDLIFGAYDRGPMEDWKRGHENPEKHLANRVYRIAPVPDEKGHFLREHYDKINLVPASEGIPGKGTFFYKFVKQFVPPNFETLEPGDEPHLMTLTKEPHWKLSCDICFEISFPELIREGTRLGADVLFCPSNDAWFHTSEARGYGQASAEIPLATDHAMFRAIENRRGVVRIVNRGITCIIDPLGRITSMVTGKLPLPDGTKIETEVHVQGAILDTVPTTRLTSAYVRFGDIFAWLCWVASFGLVGFSFTRRPPAAPASS